MMPITSGERLLCEPPDAEELAVAPGATVFVPPTESVTETVTVVEVTDVDGGFPIEEMEVGAPCVFVVGLAPPDEDVNGSIGSGRHDCVSPALMSTSPEYAMARSSPTANWTKFCAGTLVDHTKNIVLRLLNSWSGPWSKLPTLTPRVYGGLPPVQVMLEGTHSVSLSDTLI